MCRVLFWAKCPTQVSLPRAFICRVQHSGNAPFALLSCTRQKKKKKAPPPTVLAYRLLDRDMLIISFRN
jgi:hypothetical protein